MDKEKLIEVLSKSGNKNFNLRCNSALRELLRKTNDASALVRKAIAKAMVHDTKKQA